MGLPNASLEYLVDIYLQTYSVLFAYSIFLTPSTKVFFIFRQQIFRVSDCTLALWRLKPILSILSFEVECFAVDTRNSRVNDPQSPLSAGDRITHLYTACGSLIPF